MLKHNGRILLVTLIVFETTTSNISRVPLCTSCFRYLGGREI